MKLNNGVALGAVMFQYLSVCEPNQHPNRATDSQHLARLAILPLTRPRVLTHLIPAASEAHILSADFNHFEAADGCFVGADLGGLLGREVERTHGLVGTAAEHFRAILRASKGAVSC